MQDAPLEDRFMRGRLSHIDLSSRGACLSTVTSCLTLHSKQTLSVTYPAAVPFYQDKRKLGLQNV